jgi:hypothetical protein
LGHALERRGAQWFAGEQASKKVVGQGADHERVRCRDALQPRGDVERFAESLLVMARASAYVIDDHQAGMAPKSDVEGYSAFLGQARVELAHCLHNSEAGAHGPLRIVFVCSGVAEVDEQSIAEVIGDMPLVAGDHLGARLLIGQHHLAQLFGIELTGKRRRIDQITKQDGELPALRV